MLTIKIQYNQLDQGRAIAEVQITYNRRKEGERDGGSGARFRETLGLHISELLSLLKYFALVRMMLDLCYSTYCVMLGELLNLYETQV